MSETWLSRILWRFYSVPVYVKIIGVGLLLALLFGSVSFYQIRKGMYRTHYKVQGETALSLAQALVAHLSPLLVAGNVPSMDLALGQTMDAFPDVRYIVVQDRSGRILSHGFTFPKEAPPDLATRNADLCAACHAALSPTEIPARMIEVSADAVLPGGHIRAYTRNQGLILEVALPVPASDGDTLRLGVSDKVIAREMASITQSLLGSLALALIIGLSLGLGLTYVILRPVRDLVQTTERVREGDFGARARVFSNDELGRLSQAFNRMTQDLECYRREVREKEAARVSLIGKIVQAQEDERKSVARELHDQLGQSLSHILLSMQSRCDGCPVRTDRCDKLKDDIRGLIDEVRRLAWNVRPSILDDYGLDHALARYVEEMSERLAFPIDYQCAIPPESSRLAGQVEVSLFRIAQEAITNIARHAQPTQASVVLLQRNGEVSLIVEDDGRGFDVQAAAKEGDASLGLLGMRERAALVGGEFAVDSHPGKGTTVRVRIPLDKEDYANPHSDSR